MVLDPFRAVYQSNEHVPQHSNYECCCWQYQKEYFQSSGHFHSGEKSKVLILYLSDKFVIKLLQNGIHFWSSSSLLLFAIPVLRTTSWCWIQSHKYLRKSFCFPCNPDLSWERSAKYKVSHMFTKSFFHFLKELLIFKPNSLCVHLSLAQMEVFHSR